LLLEISFVLLAASSEISRSLPFEISRLFVMSEISCPFAAS
jgi:hypothetical protein